MTTIRNVLHAMMHFFYRPLGLGDVERKRVLRARQAFRQAGLRLAIIRSYGLNKMQNRDGFTPASKL